MRRRPGFVACLCLVLVLGVAATTSAQVNPSNMRSGCTSIASASGLLTAPIFFVPSGNSFVLTDLSISPTGVAAPPAPSPATWRIACWLANYSEGSTRWVTGAYGDYNVPNPTWPVQTNWTTGLVFPQSEGIQFGVSSGGGGGSFPAMTVCWSGYLVSNTTTSVIPGDAPAGPALSVAPNPAAEDVTLRFSLTRAQKVTLGVFSVEGRRVRTLHKGTMEAGSHEVAWDGRDDGGRPVADGLYFARLETSQGSRTTRIARTR